jgi:hypothetical protein
MSEYMEQHLVSCLTGAHQGKSLFVIALRSLKIGLFDKKN